MPKKLDSIPDWSEKTGATKSVVIIGMGSQRTDGYMMQSRFSIAPSSELMAILAIITDLADLRRRLGL